MVPTDAPRPPGRRRTEPSDAELLSRVAASDMAAFEIFFDRHSSTSFSLALRMVGSRALAEDVIQEAFLGLWRNVGRFDPARGSARSWLLSMVRNRGIDALRRHSVHEQRRASAESLEHLGDGGTDVDLEVIRRTEANRVQTALARLPSAQRQTLELAYYGGWTHSQIAEFLSLPLGTVKGRMRMGLERLSVSLADLAVV